MVNVPTTKYTVIYDTGESRHKLMKVMLTDDGSYLVTCPYHESDRVTLMKRVINYADPQASRCRSANRACRARKR